ncbi:MAG: c-type cytochrome [Solirubrobacteraceae bacterium]
MTRRPLLALLVGCCAAVSACDGHTHGAAVAASGRALFTQACGACHTLTGHNDPRHQGGDLRDFHATRTQFFQLASEMPVRHPLSQTQLTAVVRFVMGLEARDS